MTMIDRLSPRGVALTAGLIALSALGPSACVTTPTDGAALASPVASTTIQGYSLTASAPVVVQALNYKTGQWDTIGQGTASPTVTIPQNTAGQNPALYAFSVTASVASASDPRTFCRWINYDSSCDTATIADIGACDFAKVRVQVGGFNALTFYSDGSTCVQQEMAAGANAVNAAISCQSNESPVLTLRSTTDICIL
ncbi:hypothetical protein [Sorangium sp. So ce131]|uniref:hypothetical protein n=1 Tax=Sorangium sp. So ce131 TaxID=3133282 RepID=UPI003F5D6834